MGFDEHECFQIKKIRLEHKSENFKLNWVPSLIIYFYCFAIIIMLILIIIILLVGVWQPQNSHINIWELQISHMNLLIKLIKKPRYSSTKRSLIASYHFLFFTDKSNTLYQYQSFFILLTFMLFVLLFKKF